MAAFLLDPASTDPLPELADPVAALADPIAKLVVPAFEIADRMLKQEQGKGSMSLPCLNGPAGAIIALVGVPYRHRCAYCHISIVHGVLESTQNMCPVSRWYKVSGDHHAPMLN